MNIPLQTEDEILTLRQVLNARQKHASELKRYGRKEY